MKYSRSDKKGTTISSRLSRIAGITFLLFCTSQAFAQAGKQEKDTVQVTETLIIADTIVKPRGKGGISASDTMPPQDMQKKIILPHSATPTTQAQKQAPDTLVKAPKVHSPKKAAIYSAVLPGLGQAYNRKYWKIPVIYVGFAGLGYAVYYTNNNYQEFRQAYALRLDTIITNDTHPLYSTSGLQLTRDAWHRNRDLSIVGCLALYTLQVIDATVDAHLYKFDEKINDKLSLQLEPQPFMGMQNKAPVSGLRLIIKL